MKRIRFQTIFVCLLLNVSFAGCGAKYDPSAGAPPPLKVETAEDPNVFQTGRPDQFPLATAVEHVATPQLKATGTVSPDISRNVPVISLASGRVVEIAARLGDTVKKGQLLLRVQSSDISSAFSDYQKAVADELLTRTQLERAELLYEKGAISKNDLQVSQNTDAKAKVEVKTAAERLRVLGSPDLDHPSGIVEIRAPISGVITDQQVTNAAGLQGLSSPNPFTISDLSFVWILCDVYENDLANVHVGENADIRLCGIAGFTHNDLVPEADRIRDVISTLVHRGPDQQGVFESHIVSMGATRLKIIDLKSGDQPVTTDEGDAAIVFNGEIYNHNELRAELQSDHAELDLNPAENLTDAIVQFAYYSDVRLP